MNCKNCEAALSRQNRTGYCKHCVSKFTMRPDTRAKISAGLKRRFAIDPEAKDRARRQLKINANVPGAYEKRRDAAIKINLAGRGRGNMTAETYAKIGRSITASRLAWCPAELRDRYQWLVRSKKVPAAEAREIILAQHRKDMLAFRRKCLGLAA